MPEFFNPIAAVAAAIARRIFGRRPPPPSEQLNRRLAEFALQVAGGFLTQADIDAERARLSALPAPQVPTPAPAPTQPRIPGFGNFPGGPAANDPVFRERLFGRLAGRILGPGSLVLLGAEILVREIERRQLERMQETIDAQAEDQVARDRRQARDSQVRTISERIPDFIGDRLPRPPSRTEPRLPPRPEQFPPSPEIEPLPVPLPGGVPPIRIPFPGQEPRVPVGPVALPSPGPVSQPRPSVRVGPGGFETADVGILPDRLPSLFPLPFGRSSLRVGDPVPQLTPLQPGSLSSPVRGVIEQPIPLQAIQAQTQQCRPRRCDDELDEQRDECFKGLYREGPFDTEFTQWVKIDCLTGRELGESDNVIEFPGIDARAFGQ